MYDLKDKVALVTGASRGIGRAIALELAQCGARVVINYASQHEQAQETKSLMGSAGLSAHVLGFDVSDEEAVNQAISQINDSMGGVDILVNNAGVAIDALLMRVKIQDFDRQINTNLKGALLCSKAVSRSMIKKKSGRIINISSVVGQMGNAGQSVYAAAKAGLLGFTKSLARELASRNILVNAVAPGYIATDMTKDLLHKNNDDILQHIPLGKVGQPEDVAHAVAFLASDHAAYITGQVLSVNGGMYI